MTVIRMLASTVMVFVPLKSFGRPSRCESADPAYALLRSRDLAVSPSLRVRGTERRFRQRKQGGYEREVPHATFTQARHRAGPHHDRDADGRRVCVLVCGGSRVVTASGDE